MQTIKRFTFCALAALALLCASTNAAQAATGIFVIDGYVPAYGVYVVGIGEWEGDIIPDGFGGYTLSGTWVGEGTVSGYGFPWVGSGVFSGGGSDIDDIGVDAGGVFSGQVWVNGGGTPFNVSGFYDTIYADED